MGVAERDCRKEDVGGFFEEDRDGAELLSGSLACGKVDVDKTGRLWK